MATRGTGKAEMTKRLIVLLDEKDHLRLEDQARKERISVSNYVRRALGIPEERQGVKRQIRQKRSAAAQPGAGLNRR